MPLNSQDIAKALVQGEHSIRYAARTVLAAYTTIHGIIVWFQETHTYKRRSGPGQSRAITTCYDQFLVRIVLRNRHTTAVVVPNRVEEVRGNNVRERTIRRWLKESKLGSFKSATGLDLLARYRGLAYSSQGNI